MEPNKIKLKLTPEEEKSLTQPLIALGTDLANNADMKKEDIIKLYLYSQQNCKMILQRIEENRDNESVSLKQETLVKLARFRKASRKHIFAGGEMFKDENEAISFLLDVALKLGKNFLDKLVEPSNFQSVTSSMKPSEFDDKKKRNKKVEKEFKEDAD